MKTGSENMTGKEKVMGLIESELTILIGEYEKQLDTKNTEIQKLKKQVLESNARNVELMFIIQQQAKEIELNKRQSLSYPNILEDENLMEFRNTLERNDLQEIADLASAMEQLWNKRENKTLINLLKELNSTLYRNQFKISDFNHRISIICKEILSATETIDCQLDSLIKQAINYGIKSIDTNGEKLFRDLLRSKHTEIFTALLDRNESNLIRDYFRLLLVFKQEKTLKEALEHIITVEWSFLLSTITEEDFEFYFWYSYLFNSEQGILESVKDFYPQGMQNEKDFDLYYQATKLAGVTEESYRVSRNAFRSNKNFTNLERNMVLKKVDSRIKQRLLSGVQAHEAPVYIITASEYGKLKQTLGLQRKRVKLPLYQRGKPNQIYLYKEIDVWFSKDRGRAFLANKDYRAFSDQIAPLVIKTGEMRYTIPPEEQVKVQSDSFAWPPTEVKTTKENLLSDEKILNETSELKKLGYQITGVTRAKRWQALELAVPKLGLKKVVGIISYNILLRKGQKNGERKFSYAIAEWEHDLGKLKKHYYRSDFKWPDPNK